MQTTPGRELRARGAMNDSGDDAISNSGYDE